jgi:hypothetical protein
VVRVEDLPLRIDDQHGVGEVLHHRAEPLLTLRAQGLGLEPRAHVPEAGIEERLEQVELAPRHRHRALRVGRDRRRDGEERAAGGVQRSLELLQHPAQQLLGRVGVALLGEVAQHAHREAVALRQRRDAGAR